MSEELAAGAEVASFFCPGRPRTKGSLKPVIVPGVQGGRRGMKVMLQEQTEHSKPWKHAMMSAAVRSLNLRGGVWTPYAGPVTVHATYVFARELATNGQVREAHRTPYPTSMDIGDLDKLDRNLLDALTQSGLIADDRLVVAIYSFKVWKALESLESLAGVRCTVTAAL